VPSILICRLGALLLAALLLPQARAHEYWFEPETFFAQPGQRVPVHLYVGDGLVKDVQERPYQPQFTPLFLELTEKAQRDLRPLRPADARPVHEFSATAPGSTMLAMHRDWFHIRLAPAKFEAYLREDGIEYILEERKRRGESGKEGRERYSRYIKALLQVGTMLDDTYRRELGLKLEITPLANPYAKKVGDTLTFAVTFEGQPLAGRAVFADSRGSATQKMITDAQGRVTMRIAQPGLWLVRLVYMQRCQADCGEADWESYWGAFSFGAK
jgi:uncharacterized GH25 family protein